MQNSQNEEYNWLRGKYLNPYEILKMEQNDNFSIARSQYQLLISQSNGSNKQMRAKVSLAFDMLSKQRQNNYKFHTKTKVEVINKNLFYYSLLGDVESIRTLIASGKLSQSELIKAQDELNRTCLYIAARCGHYELCGDKFINQIQKNGSSALHGAAFYGQINLTKLLLCFKADLSIKNQYGVTALEETEFKEIQEILKNPNLSQIQELQYKICNISCVPKPIYDFKKENIIAYRIERLENNIQFSSKYQQIMKKWEKVYHGTKYKYLESIMEIGLKKPGDKDKYGNFISEQIGHIKSGVTIGDIKNWSKAIFVTPSIFYAADPVYSEIIIQDGFDYASIVEAYVKPNTFIKYPSTVISRQLQAAGEPQNVEYRVEPQFEESCQLYRVEQSGTESIIVSSILFVKIDFLNNIQNYNDAQFPFE